MTAGWKLVSHGDKYYGDKYYGDKYYGEKYYGDKYYGDYNISNVQNLPSNSGYVLINKLLTALLMEVFPYNNNLILSLDCK